MADFTTGTPTTWGGLPRYIWRSLAGGACATAGPGRKDPKSRQKCLRMQAAQKPQPGHDFAE